CARRGAILAGDYW
nr:immunoglobulin heavy chain junction region [Mus musculus]NSM06576.1 immunoglobulin heavy chain junction region [Mus musculus]NSM07457.1 immunoglobulin heavy chain junction region [Mus musculus]NSM07756.1 immunoglobulin heavy chain junction region [Mus musculus]NSM08026.1 immunoglobulin heavy chain junction region [Mus musculus]